VAELADALALGASARKGIGVRLPSPAPIWLLSKEMTEDDKRWFVEQLGRVESAFERRLGQIDMTDDKRPEQLEAQTIRGWNGWKRVSIVSKQQSVND
jgi:hypothetical protein